MSILDTVRQAYAAGLSILPVRDDGSKAPAGPSWEQYKTERPTPAEMRAWGFEHRDGFGMIAGPVSGHRETWDFDDAKVFEAFVSAATAAGLGDIVQRIRGGYEDRTPSGGVRWIVTYPANLPWSDQTFARRPGGDGEPKIKTLIEGTTFAILAPSNGRTHPSGGAYVRQSGGFATIASYTADERDALIVLARSFDQMPRREFTVPTTQGSTVSGTRPGDDYNRRMTWPQILEPHGWMAVETRGDLTRWRRPGKTFGISATTNIHGSDLLWVFSSSTAFEQEKGYNKFGAYALLEHGGDFRKAALALSQQGYGDQGGTTTSAPSGFSRPAVIEGLGDCVLQPRLAHPYSGWFMRGGVHLVAGSSGAGKTTLLLDLLQQQARGGAYLGHVGSRLDFLVIFADRGRVSNDETLERMRILPGSFPMAHVPPVAHGAQAVTAILHAIEAQADLPAVVFLEGADMLVEDASKTQVVSPFMGALRKIAEHYSLAIILSVGAPKAKPHEQYALKRDQVFGSQAWARLANDVLVMSITGDGSVPTRDLVVLHRNAAAEKFQLTFVDGRLVEAADQGTSEPDMLAWFRDVEVFTKQRFRDAFTLSGARATTLLDGYVAIGALREKVKGDRTHYVYRRPSPPKPDRTAEKTDGQSDSGPDTFQDEIRTETSVRKTTGHGHENESVASKNPKDFASSDSNPLIPTKTVSVVRNGHSLLHETDNGHGFKGSTRAREAGGDSELVEPTADTAGAKADDDPNQMLVDLIADLKSAFGGDTTVTLLPETGRPS